MTQNGDRPEDEKAQDAKAEDETGAPEVEAEVVGNGDDSSPSAFDETTPEIEDALAGAEEELAPKKSPLTPGVLVFLAFAALALAAFFVWRLQSGDKTPAVEGATQAAPQAETQRPPAEAEGPPAESESGEAAEETPPLPEPSGKIENTPTDKLTPPDEAEAPADSFLPPVSERDAEKIANTVEAGAAEAMRRMQEAEESEAPEEDQQTDEIGGFDIAPDEGDAVKPAEEGAPAEAPEEDAQDDAERAETQQAESGTGEIAQAADASQPMTAEIPAKIVNDLEELRGETARLESALRTERERNANLAAEIAELRQGFEAALAARDERFTGELADMRASLEKIQNSEIEGATDQLRANLALGALRRKVEAGEPFADELTAVAEFAPDRASALAPYAHSGVPTDAALRESFGAAAREALAAAGQAEAGGGVSGVIARAKNLVSVRPAAPQAGDAPRAVISRAEHAVGEGDLTYALNELDSLPASAKDAMAEWIKNAQANNEAQQMLSELSARLNSSGSE